MRLVKNVKCKSNETMHKGIHKYLVREIKRVQRELQSRVDKKFGKGKVRISEVYASKILAGRVKK